MLEAERAAIVTAPAPDRQRVCLVTAVPFFVEAFLLDQIAQLSKCYEVTLLVNTADLDLFKRLGIDARIVSAPIQRKIDIVDDLKALLFLIRFFRRGQFSLVHSTTPKAGLLSMLAAWATRVPVRIHTFTGQVWFSRRGLMHWLLKNADRLIAWAATDILTDSFSQLDFLLEQRVVSAAKARVLAHGSLSGVNLQRFRRNDASRAQVRRMHGIPQSALLFLYMARLTRDKGALLMAEGFSRLDRMGVIDSHLLIVGPDEEGLRPRITEICAGCRARVHLMDYTRVPEESMSAADVFCLPSYREGFGTVFINSAAAGIPAIASRIYGSQEAVLDNLTGLLHEPGNADDLAEKMRVLGCDAALRARLGGNARARVERDFSESAVTGAVLEFYAQAIAARTAVR